MDNANTAEYLEKIKNQVIENIRRTMNNPSVQMTDVPRDPEGLDDEADAVLDDLDEDENPDTRYTQRRWDKYTEKEGELSESEDEEGNERNGVRKTRPVRQRMNLLDFPNAHAAPDDESELVNALEKDAPTVATNGTAEHAASDPNSPPPKSSPPVDEENADADVEMAETAPEPEPELPARQSTPGPQEATPPASPPNEPVPTEAAAPAADQPVEEAENDAAAQAEGIEEREQEKSTAEQSMELAEQTEQT